MNVVPTELETHKTLAYQPLSPSSIRLAQILPISTANNIQCRLFHIEQESRTPYNALSYCWGDHKKAESIEVNGCTFRIGTGLHDALISIVGHHDATTPLWVDALCINQDDTAEKSVQVQRMWHIFHNARQVLAWLGPEPRSDEASRNVQIAIDAMEAIEHNSETTGITAPVTYDEPSSTHIVAGAKELATRQYFTRAWVVSEVAQARDLIFICGRLTCDWKSFQHIVTLISATTLPEVAYVSDLLQRSVRAVEYQWLDERQMSKLMMINEVFHIYSSRSCEDRRDCVFAMLGHPTIREICGPMLPDYSMNEDEVFIATLSWVDSSIANEQLSDADATTTTGAHDEVFQRYATFFLSRLSFALLGHAIKPGDFSGWMFDHAEWDMSHIYDNRKLILPGGQNIDLSGRLLTQFF